MSRSGARDRIPWISTRRRISTRLSPTPSDPGRFHVPGHKGGRGADPELVEALGRAALEHDIPAGIEGIDIGADP